MTPEAEQAEIARIAAIVAERVRQALAPSAGPPSGIRSPQPPQPLGGTGGAGPPAGPRALAVFTGGELGLDAALQGLAALRAEGWRLDALLSPRAAEVIGAERARQATGGPVVAPPPSASLAPFLDPYAAVLVPVLTRSSAARLAVGITDTLATEAIWQALMLGKPVVAARNAADPGADCPAVVTRRAPEAARRLLEGHLQTLEELGIRLVDSAELVAAARAALGEAPAARAESVPRTVVTGEDVRQAAEAGEKLLAAGAGSQVTHVARDLAQRLGVRIRIVG